MKQCLQIADVSSRFSLVLFVLFTKFKFIASRLICALNFSYELQVWQTSDRHGHTYWHAYDPTTGSSVCVRSAAEMRIWLEQRYYN